MTHCATLIEALKNKGYRITPQREMIVEALAHGGEHATADQVYERVRLRSHAVNLATIYRTLDLLVDTGLANKVEMPEGQAVYATARHGPHLHLICRQCGGSITADSDLVAVLDQNLQRRYAFKADLQHISLVGVCDTCAGKPTRESAED